MRVYNVTVYRPNGLPDYKWRFTSYAKAQEYARHFSECADLIFTSKPFNKDWNLISWVTFTKPNNPHVSAGSICESEEA